MRFLSTALAVLAALSLVSVARAQDTGNFLVQLGNDTTSVETYTRTPAKLMVDQVGRAPRVLQRHFVYEYDKGAIVRFSLLVTPPRDTTATQRIHATFGPDSMRMNIVTPGRPDQNVTLGLPAGTIAVVGSSPWAVYEGQTMKLMKSKPDSLRAPMWLVGAPSVNWLTVTRMGKDSVNVFNDHGDLFHARVDKDGRVLGVLPISGTAKFAVQRVPKMDLMGMADAFVARDKAGGGLGTLSPRDSVKTTVAGASLYVDYGRPSKRGRTVVGGILVPYGQVWRTGANAATQFRTDKALDFGGGVVVPPGFYTLWTLPSASGWKLIVNSETGQWGTEHKPEKDLYTIPMKVSTLSQVAEKFTISVDPAPQGGAINLDWDTTRASAGFAVKP